jgi:glycosyltransferase involved in cell wall biosynthesis
VFFIASYLETDLPIVLWIDSPLFALIGLYSYFTNLCEETPRDIFILEKQALGKASLIIVTSDWAKSTMINLYDLPSEKIQVIPRGANLEIVPERSIQDIKLLINQRNKKVCHLLFSGVEWARKGGDVAIGVVAELNRMGLPTELIVIGCQPEIEKPYPSFVTVHGYINKSTQEGKEKIIDLIASSHFLILPTKADTNPHVLTEANGFGVPCLATNIMGINTVIKDGLNGQTFPLDAPIDDYCKFVMDHFRNYTEYENLAVASFGEYLYRLNWDVASRRAIGLFRDLLGSV